MISTSNLVVAIAQTYKGCVTGDARQRDIIRVYNSINPPYRMSVKDPWCAYAWSAWQIMAGNTKGVPLSASCSFIIAQAKKLEIWVENDGYVPKMGDAVIYDWQDSGKGDNKGDPDHIGLIYKVDSKHIYVLEGNKGKEHVCGERAININGQFIRGFVAPQYSPLKKYTYKPSGMYVQALPSGEVKYGTTGTDVENLQKFLNWCCGLNLAIDKSCGRITTDALIRWQYTYGLVPDGVFGAKSLAKAKELAKGTKPKDGFTGTLPTLEKVLVNNQKKMADTAYKLAYTDAPKESKYPSGHPTPAYKSALAKLPASGHKWSPWARKGASCDVNVWTVIRTAGVAKPVRAGLWYLDSWLEKTNAFYRVKPSQAKKGDIYLYRKDVSGKHGHTGICGADMDNLHGKGDVKEASARSYYPRTNEAQKSRLSTKGKKYVHVYRARNTTRTRPLQKGDKGDNVRNLQRYINWYYDAQHLKIDGSFGDQTEKWLKKLQKDLGVPVTGKVDEATLKKMVR